MAVFVGQAVEDGFSADLPGAGVGRGGRGSVACGIGDGLGDALVRPGPVVVTWYSARTAWSGKLTPHVLRHFCASQLYLGRMNLFAIQELMGHAWTAMTARYIHVHATHVEDAWVTGQRRVADRWKGLLR